MVCRASPWRGRYSTVLIRIKIAIIPIYYIHVLKCGLYGHAKARPYVQNPSILPVTSV